MNRNTENNRRESIDPTEKKYTIISHNRLNDYLDSYELFLKNDSRPACPKCSRTAVSKKDMKVYERLDIVDSNPTKVRLHVQRWQCAHEICKTKFSDPRSPYSGKDQTTAELGKYVVENLVEIQNLTQVEISSRLLLTTTKVNRIINDFYVTSVNNLPRAIPFSTLYLFPCYYKGGKHLLIFGEGLSAQILLGNELTRPSGIAFLGISKEYSFESALADAHITQPEEAKRIFCSDMILKEARVWSSSRRSPEILRLSSEAYLRMAMYKMYPTLFQEILNDFERRNFSFDRARYKLCCNFAYRSHPLKVFRFEPEERFPYTLNGKTAYYIDSESLLRLYGKK